jgi:hypothetical protein
MSNYTMSDIPAVTDEQEARYDELVWLLDERVEWPELSKERTGLRHLMDANRFVAKWNEIQAVRQYEAYLASL